MEGSKCPAFGKISSVCQKENHFALKCSHKTKPHKTKKPSQKHSANPFDFDESEEEILSLSCSEEINAVDNQSNKIVATMKVGGKDVKVLIDPAAFAMFSLSRISPKELRLRNRVTPSRCTQSQPC